MEVVESLLDAMDDPALALLQWGEAYGVVQSRLPPTLAAELERIVGESMLSLDHVSSRFRHVALEAKLDRVGWKVIACRMYVA